MNHLIFRMGELFFALPSRSVSRLFNAADFDPNSKDQALVSLPNLFSLDTISEHCAAIKRTVAEREGKEMILALSKVENEVFLEEDFWRKPPRFLPNFIDGAALYDGAPALRINAKKLS